MTMILGRTKRSAAVAMMPKEEKTAGRFKSGAA